MADRVPRAADRVLELLLVAYAAWTVVYHVAVVLGAGAAAAAPAWAVVTLVAGRWLLRVPETEPVSAAAIARAGPRRRPMLAIASVVAAALAGVLFAIGSAPWALVWAAWVVSSWIAAHGRFPVRDVVFSDEVFPALYHPPVSSFEALSGTAARLTGIEAPDLVYGVVPPLATALAVLALWRLLRAWGTPHVAVALSAALAFLLLGAAESKMYGAFFAGRMWQGKVVFLAVLVPLLFALVHEYAGRPSARRAALICVAGVAGVGLTTSAVFVVVVIVAGCMAGLAVSDRRAAAIGCAAGIAYPMAAGVATLALGGRVPDVYTDDDVRPGMLVHLVLGTGVVGLLAIVVALAGPMLVGRSRAALMVAATVLLVGVLFAPGVPELIFHTTGLGRVLWRLTWALPVAALAGAGVAALAAGRLPGLDRALPAAALLAVLVVWGAPVWAGATEAAGRPAWKRPPAQVSAAHAILAMARSGDVVLAPSGVSQTLLVASGRLTTVSPRRFYTEALAGTPAARVAERLRLQRFADRGAAEAGGARGLDRALRDVGVDLACVDRDDLAARRVLDRAGYAPIGLAARLVCLRQAIAGNQSVRT